MDDPVVQLLLNFRHFENPRTPKTKKMQVQYGEIIGGDLSESVRNMLDLGTQQRRLLVQALTYAGATPNPQNLIGAANAYIPAVWQIQKSLEFSKDTRIKINAPLHFEWTSALGNVSSTGEPRSQSQGVFVFELTFVLLVRAVAHYNLARQSIERIYHKMAETNTLIGLDDPLVIDCLKEAIKQLRVGAGVLEFTSKSVISQWKKPPADPLPETRPKVLDNMVIFYLCMAQRVFMARILLSKKYALLPNLFMGLGNKYEGCASSLSKETSIFSNIPIPAVDIELIDESLFFGQLSKALARKYLGLILHEQVEKGELDVGQTEEAFGSATGFLKLAVNDISDKTLTKAAKSAKLQARIGNVFNLEVNNIKTISAKLESENASVYYAPVDYDKCDLPPRSQYKFMMQVEEFEMPTVTALSFEQILKAPPGVDQKTFNEMTPEIQQELLEEHKKKEAELEQEKLVKQNKGWFSGNKKKPQKNDKVKTEQPHLVPTSETAQDQVLVAPPGVDKGVFAALPRDMQLEIINNQAGHTAATTPPTVGAVPINNTAANKNNGNLPLW